MILSEYKEIIKFAMQNEVEAQKFYKDVAAKMENAFVDIGYPEVW